MDVQNWHEYPAKSIGYLCACLPVCLPACLPACLSLYLPVSLSACQAPPTTHPLHRPIPAHAITTYVGANCADIRFESTFKPGNYPGERWPSQLLYPHILLLHGWTVFHVGQKFIDKFHEATPIGCDPGDDLRAKAIQISSTSRRTVINIISLQPVSEYTMVSMAYVIALQNCQQYLVSERNKWK